MKLKLALFMLFCAMLVNCAGPPPKPAPAVGPSSATHSSTPDGFYRVRKGDNLSAVAFKFGLDWREIARLNNIFPPYIIYPDQELRLTENLQVSEAGTTAGTSTVQTTAVPLPGSSTTRAVETPASSTTTIDTQQTSAPAAELPSTAPSPAATQAATQASTAAAAGPGTPSGTNATAVDVTTPNSAVAIGTQVPSGRQYAIPAENPTRWLWPTEGKVVSRFRANDPARKGIDIGGKVGQRVVATADGQVVYSGNGLLGYGELIIIKHSDRMLSAYAHNSKRLVSEGQQVTAGNQIAEMGTNDRNQAELHFEIRVNGSPQDPLNYLPQR